MSFTLGPMAGLYRDEGVVLRTVKLGEADRIVTIIDGQAQVAQQPEPAHA